MKNKKLLTAIGAVTMAALFSASVFAGCKKEEHAFVWTTETEATCSSEGKRTGVCGICGHVKEEKIPVDKDAHVYGEWQITEPDEQKEGSAVRVCTLNAEHKAEVVLPKITEEGTGYLSHEITKQPTVVDEGVRTFVFEHASGNITFTQTLPRKKLETVEDAVLLGSSRGDLVRVSRGRYTESSTSATVTYHNIANYYNDDHTVVTDDGQDVTQYYSYDDEGKVFGIQVIGDNGAPKVMEGVNDNYILGYGYSSGGGNGLRTFGAEQTLEWYYQKGKDARAENKAVKYSEEIIISPNGSAAGTFHYSYYENPFFCRYTVDFTIGSNGVIQNLKLSTKVIRKYMIAENDNGELQFDEDGDVIFAEGYSDDHEEVSVRILEYTEQVLKTDGDVVPENPYGSKVRYITSFGIRYNGRELNAEYCPLLPSLKDFNLTVTDVLPVTADLDYDPLRVYVRTEARDIELTMSPESNPYRVIGFFNKETGKITLKASYAGKVTLVFKTKGGLAEKAVQVEFDKSAPSTIFAEAYRYSDSDGIASYNWQQCSASEDNPVTVYVGQSLKIRSATAASELAYADLSFTAEITDEATKDGVTFTEEEFEGRDVYVATPTKVGLYQVWIRYKKGNGKNYTSFYIKAEEPPRIQDVVKGEYVGTLQDIKIGNSGQSAKVTVTIEYGNDYRSGKVHIKAGELSSDYYYKFNTVSKEFELTYYNGIKAEDNPTFDFSLKVNEAYKPVITHSTTFGGGTEKESVVLSRPQTEE